MSAIHDAARTVEQAAQTEDDQLAELIEQADELRNEIANAEREQAMRIALLRNTDDRVKVQRKLAERAALAAATFRELGLLTTPAVDEPTPIGDAITRETTTTLASPAYVPPVQQGTGGSPLLPTLIPPHGLETRNDHA